MIRKIRILTGVLLLCIAAAAAGFSLPDVKAASASSSDFQMKGDTLVKYTGTASAVSIPTSVKHIGKEAFTGHTELVKVEIPGYVEESSILTTMRLADVLRWRVYLFLIR